MGAQLQQKPVYSASTFIPKNITPQYPEINMLFPALNTGLAQGLISSMQPNGAMYGAGRFLAPQTNFTQPNGAMYGTNNFLTPQTTNTQGK
jgi:hypothetical protein